MTPTAATALTNGPASPPMAPPAGGLSSAEARVRIGAAGPNAMPDYASLRPRSGCCRKAARRRRSQH
jgi:hypothetical protein